MLCRFMFNFVLMGTAEGHESSHGKHMLRVSKKEFCEDTKYPVCVNILFGHLRKLDPMWHGNESVNLQTDLWCSMMSEVILFMSQLASDFDVKDHPPTWRPLQICHRTPPGWSSLFLMAHGLYQWFNYFQLILCSVFFFWSMSLIEIFPEFT